MTAHDSTPYEQRLSKLEEQNRSQEQLLKYCCSPFMGTEKTVSYLDRTGSRSEPTGGTAKRTTLTAWFMETGAIADLLPT